MTTSESLPVLRTGLCGYGFGNILPFTSSSLGTYIAINNGPTLSFESGGYDLHIVLGPYPALVFAVMHFGPESSSCIQVAFP